MKFLLDQFTIPAANYFQLILSAVVVSIAVIAVFVGVNALADRDSARYVFNIIKNFVEPLKAKFKKEPKRPAVG